MGCIGVKATAKMTPKMKMNAMLAELLCWLYERSYSAAVPATMASATAMPAQELMSIMRRPNTSWSRAT